MAGAHVRESRARAKAVALALPRPRLREARRLVPSGPSLLAGFVLVALAVASYGVARETPLFAIRDIEVRGGPPDVRARVRRALEPLAGESLVGLRAQDLDRRIASLPDVVGVTHDRAFPHTLRVYVRAERPLLVLRRGSESWLVSARARVVRTIPKGARPGLPRIWVRRDVEVGAGQTLGDTAAARAVRVLALAADLLPTSVRVVKLNGGETTLLLRSGTEVRLGREHDLRLKLSVAAEILPQLTAASTYLDVAVPDRPVADGSTEAQVEVEALQP